MSRCIRLVLQYDGGAFSGWQRQPDTRTVQGELESALERLCQTHIAVTGAGRTDAGVHARGQVAGVTVPERWTAAELSRALNAVLPGDVRISGASLMRAEFHARYSATRRAYCYLIGTSPDAGSPFRRRYELAWTRDLDRAVLDAAASALVGDHAFRAFAVRGTAPEDDHHRCMVTRAEWTSRDDGMRFDIEANRFLHHMVRFIVGTMLDSASGKRDPESVKSLLVAADNRDVSPPAPPHGLYLDRVDYPPDLYLVTE